MIHVTRKEIEKAFRRHKSVVDSAKKWNHTYSMVLFYAVECGLKALYMRDKKLKGTGMKNSENESAGSFGHDLNTLLTKLGLSYKLPQVIDRNKNQVDSQNLHEAWRYGKILDENKESGSVKRLEKIFLELKNKIG